MEEALLRGLAILRKRAPNFSAEVPTWLTKTNFVHAVSAADPWMVGGLVQRLRAVERQLRAQTAKRSTTAGKWRVVDPPPDVQALPQWAADEPVAQTRMVVALGRLALGAAIEAALVEETLDRAEPGARVAVNDRRIGRLYQDAFLASIWTSAHAQYVSCIQFGIEEPPPPSIHTFPNSFAEFDFSDVYQRRFCQRLCPKGASPLLQVMCRSTNPGSRGWNTLLDTTLNESMATRNVVTNAVIIALSGMHQFLHPALRPPWNVRMQITRVAQHHLVDADARAALVGSAAATKEAVRRMLASTVNAAPALHAGLAHVGHPVGFLVSPPMYPPSRSMESSMASFVRAGLQLIAAPSSPAASYADVVNAVFGEEAPRSRGKGTCSVHQKMPLVTVASDLWASAFRANFLVFWAHCTTKSIRASRLDPVQHRAIHELNTATKLTLELSESQQLMAQRVALRHVSAGLLTIEEAAHALGIRGIKVPSSNGGAKNPEDALNLLSAAGAESMALMLVFARVAWVSEELLVVDLGEDTRRRQLRAIYKRLGRTDYTETSTGEELPVHATHVHACLECRRIASACSNTDTSKPGVSFTELGTSSSMLCLECTGDNVGTSHIRCAKRSSAALRSALTMEETMAEKLVELQPVDVPAVTTVLSGMATGPDSDPSTGLAARARRDAKSSLEQARYALACGERPALRVPVVGRAVRIFGGWYAICGYCGCILRVLPHNRFGSEICCLRCDAQMLGVPAPKPKEVAVLTCRYCQATDPVRASTRWKTVKSPLDTSGENANLPRELRTCAYCPKHWRSWLTSAHRIFATRIILSHLAHNAKPIASASRNAVGDAPFAAKKGRKRKNAPREEGMDE